MSLTNGSQQVVTLQARIAAERLDELREVTRRGDIARMDQALGELQAAISAVDTLSAAQETGSALVSSVLDQALAGEELALSNDNGNDNENANRNSNENLNDAAKHPRSAGHCGESADTSHPAAEKLGNEFGVGAGEIMGWFCGGYGFGEISLAYNISKQTGMPVTAIFQQRAGGMGWGKIMQSYGLIGEDASANGGPNKVNHSGNGGNGKNQAKGKQS
jgi:hypothetical protein